MTWDRDSLSRTAKLLLDSNRAASTEEAVRILEGWVLQVDVGPGIEHIAAAQAALATVVNTGHRAFKGGVVVRADDDPVLTEGWIAGRRLSAAVEELGGRMTETLNPDVPTIVIGDPTRESVGRIVLWTTWAGWAGGVVEDRRARLDRGEAMVLSGVVAGGLGVSEAFQHLVGSTTAGRRDVGISLWRPDLLWRDPDATGPRLGWLPSALWLLGLGHLGQAYAWTLGWLPYATPRDVMVFLMDTDIAVKGNIDTGLLLREEDRGRRKTRVVAERLEMDLGMRTAVVERLFDGDVWPNGQEPLLALAGFDDASPRRLLGGQRSEGPRFSRVIDAGLGAGPFEYLGIRLHTFPSQLDPATAFPEGPQSERPMPEAYLAELERQVEAGADPGVAACGMTEIAGIAVAAAFVGAIAASLVMGDVLREMHGGRQIAIVALDLRSPDYVDTADNTAPGPYVNTGATAAR